MPKFQGFNFKGTFKSPLLEPTTKDRKARKCKSDVENVQPARPVKISVIDHEAVIAGLLSKAFKVPIADYVPEYTSKTLGLRKIFVRRALHDPTLCHALILYTPIISDSEKTKYDDSNKPVHVVCDPVLSNILRPHQREGVKFMYDCVTGVKGEFCGCIMADEVFKSSINLKWIN